MIGDTWLQSEGPGGRRLAGGARRTTAHTAPLTAPFHRDTSQHPPEVALERRPHPGGLGAKEQPGESPLPCHPRRRRSLRVASAAPCINPSPKSACSVSLNSFKVFLKPFCFEALDLHGKRPLTFLILSSIIRLLWDKTSTPRLKCQTKILLFVLSDSLKTKSVFLY